MTSSASFLLDAGVQFSAALDPHRAAGYRRAIKAALDAHGNQPSVALLGWQSATLIDAVAGRAKRIVIFEQDPELAENVQAGITAHGLGDGVTVVQQDPATATLDEKVDIVVVAHSSTWLMEGPGAAILDNARKNLVASTGTLIPRRFVHVFELAASPTEINGISLRVPRYTRPTEPVPTLSESKHWATSDAHAGFATQVEDTIIVYPLLSGTLTGLRLTSLAELSENNVQPAAHSGFQSVFVPLREDIKVEAGQATEIFVRYEMGAGMQQTRFSARALHTPQVAAWSHDDHPKVQAFRAKIREMIRVLDESGRGPDLDKVVSYTINPSGDVSRLAAVFWTVDEEFRKPLRDLVDGFRVEAASFGANPTDDVLYELMLSTYQDARGQTT